MTLQPSSRLWYLVPLGALVFLLWANHSTLRRADTLARLGDTPEESHAAGTRQFLARNHDALSYQWLLQTDTLLRSGDVRVRHVDYDNAPQGREVRTPSPYRLWLALVAGVAGALEGRPATGMLESAARYADPILHAVFLLVTALLVRRWFGVTAAVVHSVAAVTLVPFVLPFLGGGPGDHGLSLLAAWFALVPILAHLRRRSLGESLPAGERSPRATEQAARLTQLAFWAGVAGAFTFWVNAATGLAVLGALLVGGLVAALLTRRGAPAAAADWPAWGVGGSAGVLLFFVAEYAPNHLATWQLEYLHPLWGVAWLGAAGLLQLLVKPASGWRRILIGTLSLAAIAGPLVVLFRTPSRAVLTAPLSLRAPTLPGSLGTDSLASWLGRVGFTAPALAASVAFIAIVGLAMWKLWRRHHGGAGSPGDPATRGLRSPVLAMALTVTLVLGALAVWQLYWWTLLSVSLLALLAVTAAHEPQTAPGTPKALTRWFTRAVLLCALIPSLFTGIARAKANRSDTTFSEADIAALVERDIAHWLAQRVGSAKAVVLAPPGLTAALCFHGGLRGLGTPSWENKDGIEGAIRIAGATSPDEGHAIAQKRELTHIVLPSWDQSLEALVQANAPASSTPLIATLHEWQAPRWLRPVAYPMPSIPGFESHSVKIFEVVEVQDNALALSRFAEYFVETQRMREAVAVAMALEQSFPNELPALVARVLVAKAIRDTEGLNSASTALLRLVAAPLDPMPWDRHVALVIALAELQRFDLARVQLEQVLAAMDEPQLRQLSSVSLFRLLLICKLSRQEIPDVRLRNLAVQLLPPEMRSRVQ